jgi:phthiocerol/phenolphthiocerol synthesis type-I polyketide synthase E
MTAIDEGDQSGARIAIVGMAVRIPNADSLESFWSILEAGKQQISRFTEEQLRAAGVAPESVTNGTRVAAFGALENVDLFDADFFGFTPREAEILDPQHRIFLETAWSALQDSGTDPGQFAGRIGVFGGVGLNAYLIHNLLGNQDLIDTVGAWSINLGNDKDFVPSRVAYKLDLQGPAVAVNTACSTSLVSIVLGSQSLQSYQSDMAICGGCSIHLPQDQGYDYHQGGILSPDGRCRPFDRQAAGTYDANGAAVVALKRLDDALSEGDRIYSIISGYGLNNDGSLKAGFTAPSVDGQSEVIRDALEMAEIAPEDIGFVEAHGTGTQLGDEIELKALNSVFGGASNDSYRYLGSLKSNFGHLDTAAGGAGVIKASLALKSGTIPPTASVTDPVESLILGKPPFIVNSSPVPFPTFKGRPRFAGVSSFGIGGTNAHLILEEPPFGEGHKTSRSSFIVPVSSVDEDRLGILRGQFESQLGANPSEAANIAYTAQRGRKGFCQRGFFIISPSGEAEVSNHRWRQADSPVLDDFRPNVVFLLGGQDTFDSQVIEALFNSEPEFRRQYLKVTQRLKQLGLDDVGLVVDPLEFQKATNPDSGTLALFCAEYAICRMWGAWGITPSAMLGVSLGEYVAAVLTGVISLDDGLRIVAQADRFAVNYPKGQTVAVGCGSESLRKRLPSNVYLAVSASPAQSILSGPPEVLESFCNELKSEGLAVHPNGANVPFHSPLMREWVDSLAPMLDNISFGSARTPYVSCVTGDWVTDADVADPVHYRKIFETEARLEDSIVALKSRFPVDRTIFLEAGIGSSIESFIRQAPSMEEYLGMFSTAPETWRLHAGRNPRALSDHLLSTVGDLWTLNAGVDWLGFSGIERLNKVSIPHHPFRKESYWVSPCESKANDAVPDDATKKLPIERWFHVPYWKPNVVKHREPNKKEFWILFGDSPLLEVISSFLTNQGVRWENISDPGSKLLDGQVDTFDLDNSDAWDQLFSVIGVKIPKPDYFVYCPSLNSMEKASSFDGEGLRPLIYLGRQLGANYFQEEVTLAVAFESGGDRIAGALGDVFLGPVRVLPQEFRNISAGLIQVEEPVGVPVPDLGSFLVSDIVGLSGSARYLRRGRVRFDEAYSPISLPPPDGLPSLLREKGSYLITGGLGHIGMTIARHLLSTADANIVLTTRGRNLSQGQSDLVNQYPGKVLTVRARAEDFDEMTQAVAVLEEKFGRLDGVIHAAGLVGDQSFLTIGEAPVESHLDQFPGKVGGVEVIERLLEARSPDFVFLCSSLSPALGGLGFAAYASANAMLDRYADDHAAQNAPIWVGINWEGWRGPDTIDSALGDSDILEKELTPEEGCAVFDRIANQANFPRILVSTSDFEQRRSTWVHAATLPSVSFEDVQMHSRPEILGLAVAGDSDTEKRLIGIWERLLGIAPLGTTDNFFELGGNSLILTQFVASARQEFSVDLPLVALFESPRIDVIATTIDHASSENASVSGSRQRGVI